MAEGTKTPFSGRSGDIFVRRLGVFGRGPMTDFTGKTFMIGISLEVIYVLMAIFAGSVSGILYRLRGNLRNRIGAVMTIFAK